VDHGKLEICQGSHFIVPLVDLGRFQEHQFARKVNTTCGAPMVYSIEEIPVSTRPTRRKLDHIKATQSQTDSCSHRKHVQKATCTLPPALVKRALPHRKRAYPQARNSGREVRFCGKAKLLFFLVGPFVPRLLKGSMSGWCWPLCDIGLASGLCGPHWRPVFLCVMGTNHL
jgi:hypothetical protein